MSTPKFPTLESIVHGYALNWRDLDRLHREMEQSVNHWQGDHDGLDALVTSARASFFKSVEALQAELLRQKKLKFPDQVHLLVVRTVDIDTLAHGIPHQVLEVIPTFVRQIIRGLTKVEDLGFNKAVIAADHGFILVHEQEPGNVAPRPIGTWVMEKQRCMLGQGQADSNNNVMKSSHLGIPGDIVEFAAPKAQVPYMRGQMYYHEGLSLQECVLPCLTIELVPTAKFAKPTEMPALMLSYRQGKSDCITTRRPVLDLMWSATDLFADEREIEVAIEVVDTDVKEVGWLGTCSSLNPATGSIRIKPGNAVPVGLRMDGNFSGKFTVRILNASTNVQLTTITLKTGYME